MSVSLEATLGDQVRAAARKAGMGISSWLAEAAQDKLRAEALREYLDDWQKEHGPFTPEERREADRKLGFA